MSLTTAQLQALKTDLAANVNTVVINGTPAAINVVPQGGQNAQTIADWYNLTTAAFWVWATNVDVNAISDQILWTHYTPTDAPDATVQWSNRSLACQGKHFNIEIMLQGRAAFNAAKPTLRGGLNDATTNLPSGVSGASASGGWAGILPILRRLASNVEKLYGVQTTGVGTLNTDPLGATTNPALMNFEGQISGSDIIQAWSS